MEGDDISLARALLPSAILALVMTLCAIVLTKASGLVWDDLPLSYSKSAASLSLVFLMVAIFSHLVTMARTRSEKPLKAIIDFAADRTPLLLLPAIIAPLFLAGFTAVKASMGHLVAYPWDETFTQVDALIFGGDPWRGTHALVGETGTAALGFIYTLGWSIAISGTKVSIAAFGSRRFAGTFFLAMLSSCFVSGFLFAYVFASAGPIFAPMFDHSLADRFAPLAAQLDHVLAQESSVRFTQDYLRSAASSYDVAKGAGISAMPSMHIGSAMILVLAARGTRWIWPASAFLAAIWFGSVHFGYHYAIDGIPSVIVAVLMWKAANAFYRPPDTGTTAEKQFQPVAA